MKSLEKRFELFFLSISDFKNKADFLIFFSYFPSLCTSVEAAGPSVSWVV